MNQKNLIPFQLYYRLLLRQKQICIINKINVLIFVCTE